MDYQFWDLSFRSCLSTDLLNSAVNLQNVHILWLLPGCLRGSQAYYRRITEAHKTNTHTKKKTQINKTTRTNKTTENKH